MPGGGGGAAMTMMSNRASFIIDARTNSIVVHATAADMEWIKSAIANLDRPTKQVLVDVFIVEATDDFQAQIGSRLTYAQSGSGSNLLGRDTRLGVGGLGVAPAMGIGAYIPAITPFQTVQNLGNLTNNALLNPLGSFGVIMNSDTTRLGAELQAMQEEQLIKIVSNPKLFIVDNETASIADGTEIPFVIGGSLGVAPQTQFKEALLKMEVRPTITGEGNVYMSITVNKDSPISGTQPPAISKKQLVTKLIIRDGGIAMIGGINTSEASTIENGIPLFGKIPLLGNLFKSKADKKNQKQMYIFLAPKVL
jgi:type IV pilus assembly protein PilQ